VIKHQLTDFVLLLFARL